VVERGGGQLGGATVAVGGGRGRKGGCSTEGKKEGEPEMDLGAEAEVEASWVRRCAGEKPSGSLVYTCDE
jgi:hypothetical protein